MGSYGVKPCVIFDIDGTLADVEHRRRFVDGTTGKKDFKTFYEHMVNDTPLTTTIGLCNMLQLHGWPIIFCTGRPERYRVITEKWLKNMGILAPVDTTTLYMRPEGQDYAPDYKVKEEMLEQLLSKGYAPKMAFDDRDQVVQMWRRRGIQCYQVAVGNF